MHDHEQRSKMLLDRSFMPYVSIAKVILPEASFRSAKPSSHCQRLSANCGFSSRVKRGELRRFVWLPSKPSEAPCGTGCTLRQGYERILFGDSRRGDRIICWDLTAKAIFTGYLPTKESIVEDIPLDQLVESTKWVLVHHRGLIEHCINV